MTSRVPFPPLIYQFHHPSFLCFLRYEFRYSTRPLTKVPITDEDYYGPDASIPEAQYNIPDDLLIGAASSAYQIEGAWNDSGKWWWCLTRRAGPFIFKLTEWRSPASEGFWVLV